MVHMFEILSIQIPETLIIRTQTLGVHIFATEMIEVMVENIQNLEILLKIELYYFQLNHLNIITLKLIIGLIYQKSILVLLMVEVALEEAVEQLLYFQKVVEGETMLKRAKMLL